MSRVPACSGEGPLPGSQVHFSPCPQVVGRARGCGDSFIRAPTLSGGLHFHDLITPLRSAYQDHHLWGLGPLYVDSGGLEHSAHNRDPHITSLQTPFLQERDNPTGGPLLLSNPDRRSACDISTGSAQPVLGNGPWAQGL